MKPAYRRITNIKILVQRGIYVANMSTEDIAPQNLYPECASPDRK